MFGLGKLAVLESKLNIYEDLSKEMLDKLEKAVGTISDNSNKIAIILERHENRIDESEKHNQLVLKMFEEMKESNRRDHREVQRRLDDFNKKIEDLYKFRWITLGVALAVGTLVFKAPDIFSSWGWTQTSQVEMQSKIS
tara:strand:+ start:1275 stop:1691 length:417 start_codon:yes stop_codon:yes gene_type:complete